MPNAKNLVRLFQATVIFITAVIARPAMAHTGGIFFYEVRNGDDFLWRLGKRDYPLPRWVRPSDHRWLTLEFDSWPYPSQLDQLRALRNLDRLTLILKKYFPTEERKKYLDLAKSRSEQGQLFQMKFLGQSLTPYEVSAAKEFCVSGAKLIFIFAEVPSTSELETFEKLETEVPGCLRLEFAMRRYPKYMEVQNFVKAGVTRLPVSFAAPLFPDYLKTDNMNFLKNPVEIVAQDAVPSERETENLVLLKMLSGLKMVVNQAPNTEEYARIEMVKRKKCLNKLEWTWLFGPPTDSDFTAWQNLNFSRIQVKAEFMDDIERENKLRSLSDNDTEVIVVSEDAH